MFTDSGQVILVRARRLKNIWASANACSAVAPISPDSSVMQYLTLKVHHLSRVHNIPAKYLHVPSTYVRARWIGYSIRNVQPKRSISKMFEHIFPHAHAVPEQNQ